MDTLAELISYCKEPEPLGALLLTGEWGCGKTYLVEHSLKGSLENECIIVRVSLFGVSSIDILHMNVRRQWISSCGGFFGKLSNAKDPIANVKNVFGNLSSLLPSPYDELSKSVLSINVFDLVTIKNSVGNGDNKKTVVLVFDDLERSKLSPTELLGCINEYCENQQFHVIVIANEEKIKNKKSEKQSNKIQENHNKEGFSYTEIKEKVVERTIYYEPDYSMIIDSIISKRNWGSEVYNQYLSSKTIIIQNIFHTENNYFNLEKRPNNLRILKTAIQDFWRIFQRFADSGIKDIDKYFVAFIIYSMAYKSGKLGDKPEKELEYERQLANEYPGYHYFYLLSSFRLWIRQGVWDDALFEKDLQTAIDNDKNNDPAYIIRNSSFMFLEDKDLNDLFPSLLNDCYSGKLSLKRYITFINNTVVLREFESPLYNQIDWGRVFEGIKIRFNDDIDKNIDDSLYTRFYHDEDDRKRYINEEAKIYDLIRNFCKNHQVQYDNAEKHFLNEIRSNGFISAIRLDNDFDRFTNEMKQAICDDYMHASQEEKCYYANDFAYFWKFVNLQNEVQITNAKENLENMIEILSEYQAKFLIDNKVIAAGHTKHLINAIEKINSSLINTQQESLIDVEE